jgi:hypothetical protein
VRKLDLAKLVEFPPPGAFMRIDPAVEALLTGKGQICERVEACVQFCWHLAYEGADREPDKCRKYLCAALAEYASIDEAARIDLGTAAKMIELDDPRIHVVRLLRHSNVHLSVSRLETLDKPARWNGPNGREDFIFKVYFIPDLAEGIMSTREAKKYDPYDLSAMTDWLAKEQLNWGIQNVIIRAAGQYLLKVL